MLIEILGNSFFGNRFFETQAYCTEWSERLTPGQSGWLGAAAVGSIPALALSLFLQRLYFLLFLQRMY